MVFSGDAKSPTHGHLDERTMELNGLPGGAHFIKDYCETIMGIPIKVSSILRDDTLGLEHSKGPGRGFLTLKTEDWCQLVPLILSLLPSFTLCLGTYWSNQLWFLEF